ncbi:hypothetical protein ABBQ32_000389 [Trebouxia sp. C0010 RCD-2024]
MVNKPSTVDEPIAYVWDLPESVLEPSEKQSLVAALAEKTDAVARRYFSAPEPQLWVGTLKALLTPAGLNAGGDVCAQCVRSNMGSSRHVMQMLSFLKGWSKLDGCHQPQEWGRHPNNLHAGVTTQIF